MQSAWVQPKKKKYLNSLSVGSWPALVVSMKFAKRSEAFPIRGRCRESEDWEMALSCLPPLQSTARVLATGSTHYSLWFHKQERGIENNEQQIEKQNEVCLLLSAGYRADFSYTKCSFHHTLTLMTSEENLNSATKNLLFTPNAVNWVFKSSMNAYARKMYAFQGSQCTPLQCFHVCLQWY